MVKRKWVFWSAVVALLVMSSPVAAVETNVYGDPGSDDFSAALAVTSDDAGTIYVTGVFYGDFRGVTSNGWDIWMARVSPAGGFDWFLTWDAPEIDGTDFSQLNPEYPEWVANKAEIVIGADGRLASRIESTVVTATQAGSDPTHDVVTASLQEPQLVSDGELGLIGWGNTTELSVKRTRLDGTEVWSTAMDSGGGRQLAVQADGSVYAGLKLDRLGFQTPAVRVVVLSASGELRWTTDIYDACFRNGDSLITLGGEVAVLLEPARTSNPTLCDPDTQVVSSLDAASGAEINRRILKDTFNIIWCQDPRLGIIDDAHGFGFLDGDECGGGDVFWTNTGYPLLEAGSEVEAFAIVELGIIGQDTTLGYGILRTTATAERWDPAQFEYLGPVTGVMPYDMVVTDTGPVVAGRVFNTAWIGQSAGLDATAAAQPGAAALLTSTFEPSGRFLDDNASVFETDVEWLDAEGITKGCNPPDNTEFCPSASVTRGQMAAFLARALGLTDDGGGDLFIDDDGSVFEASIDKLAVAGITKGCNPAEGNTMFCPNDPVTRGQMAAFLTRALHYTDDGGGDLFSDDDGTVFESSIDKLGTAGVTRGCNPPINDQFCPNSTVSRGQMAAFLHRALG